MEKVLNADNSDRVSAFGTQACQPLTREYRFSCTIAYSGEQKKASGVHVTDTSFTYEILC